MSGTITGSRPIWHGSFLTEAEIIDDVVAKINADPQAREHWIDPRSWRLPIKSDGTYDDEAPPHAGCLFQAGMQIRNWYGLWHEENPYTKINGDDLEITDGVITDPRFPDNLSARVVEAVKERLAA